MTGLVAIVAGGLDRAAAAGVPVVAETPLVAGLPGHVWVVSRDPIEIEGARLDAVEAHGAAQRIALTPALDAGAVTVRVGGLESTVAVGVLQPCGFTAVGPTVLNVDATEVRAEFVGPPGWARIAATSEGPARVLEGSPGRYEVTSPLDPDRAAAPHHVIVGLAGPSCAPTWTVLERRTTFTLPFTTEPGARVTLEVGKRSFGPWIAGADGTVSGIVLDLGPLDRVAGVTVVDDLGNTTRGTVNLPSSAEPALAVMVEGVLVPGQPEPRLFGFGLRPDGSERPIGEVACRLPGVGALDLVPTGARGFAVGIPPRGAVSDRVRCGAGAATRDVVVPASRVVPAAVRATAWPEVLSAQVPVTRVRVVAEDRYGDRVAVPGWTARAAHGALTLDESEAPDAFQGRFAYVGTDAVPYGSDDLTFTPSLPEGGALARAIELTVEAGDRVRVSGRALDVDGLPVRDARMELGVDGVFEVFVTGPDGSAALDRASGRVASGRVADHTIDLPVVPGTRVSTGGALPEASLHLTFTGPAGPTIFVDPPLLAPGEVGTVRVVPNGATGVRVEAPIGVVGPLVAQPDGTLLTTWRAPDGLRARAATLTVAADGGWTDAVEVQVAPRAVRGGVSLAVGGITNVGALSSAALSVDVESALPVGERRFMLRFGVGAWGDSLVVYDGIGNSAEARLSVWNVDAGLGWRQTFGPRAVWVGALAELGFAHERVVFASDPALVGWRLLTPGAGLFGGVGTRALGGEVFLEARGLTLSSSGGEAGWQGPVGGLAGLVGYRVVY